MNKKRGYYKWTDEKGVKHKVHESEYKAEYVEEVKLDDDGDFDVPEGN